jgi:integrase
MRRQRFQRGSLRPRKRNGKRYWYAQWREDGRLRSKELGLCSEMTKGEAEAILAEILRPLNEKAGARTTPQAFTFESFVRSVFLEVRRREWKASTAMTSEALITTHLLPELGPLPLKSITREQMQKLLDAKARNLAESVVNHLRFHLRDIFNLALGERAVEYNPALALHTPAKCKPGKERRVLTAAEIRSALGVLPVRERLIFRFGVFEGMRPGEILGLQIQDLRTQSVLVQRRVYKGDIDSPKTKRSIREVAMTEGTRTLLQEWLEVLKDQTPTAWVFPSETGRTPLSRDNLCRRSIHPRLREIGLGWVNFQVLRRSYATLCREAGGDAKTRADQMGHHVDVNENENEYTMTTLAARLEASRKLETVVTPENVVTG